MTTAALRYLLDTDTVSYALRGDPVVASRVARVPVDRLVLSRITLAELAVLVQARPSRARTRSKLAGLRAQHPFIDLDEAIWHRFAELKSLVVRHGRAPGLSGDFDVLQAAIALEHDLVVVTNNVRHFAVFSEFAGLRVENWVAART